MQQSEEHPLITENVSLDDVRKIAARGHLYAILDACDQPAVPAKASELGNERAVSLFHGTPDEGYWAIAPYLVHVDREVFDWIINTLGQEPWGIFADSGGDLVRLWKHFQSLLVVESPGGEDLFFRYYDPRVLENFLSTCIFDEAREFFGPVNSYLAKSTESQGFVQSRIRPSHVAAFTITPTA